MSPPASAQVRASAICSLLLLVLFLAFKCWSKQLCLWEQPRLLQKHLVCFESAVGASGENLAGAKIGLFKCTKEC